MSDDVTEDEILKEFYNNFCIAASIQGRLAYLLMSIHAVNPSIWQRVSNYDPTHLLFSNMLYGTAVYIYSRPAQKPISFINRLSFSILGSLMFNYSTMQVYDYLVDKFLHKPYLLTFLGYLCGRVMLVHFLAYLYHVDSRSIIATRNMRRNSNFESMYI